MSFPKLNLSAAESAGLPPQILRSPRLHYVEAKGRHIPHAPLYPVAVGVRNVVANLPRNFTVYPDRSGFITSTEETPSGLLSSSNSAAAGYFVPRSKASIFRRIAVNASSMATPSMPTRNRQTSAINAACIRSLGHHAKRSDQDLHRCQLQGSGACGLPIRIQQIRGQRMGQHHNPNYPIFDRAGQALIGAREPAIWSSYTTATVDRDRRNQSPSVYAVNQLSILDDKVKLLAGDAMSAITRSAPCAREPPRATSNIPSRTINSASPICRPNMSAPMPPSALPARITSTSPAIRARQRPEAGVKFSEPNQRISGSISYL